MTTIPINFNEALEGINFILESDENVSPIYREDSKWKIRINDLITDDEIAFLREQYDKNRQLSVPCRKIELLYRKLLLFARSMMNFVNTVDDSMIVALSSFSCSKCADDLAKKGKITEPKPNGISQGTLGFVRSAADAMASSYGKFAENLYLGQVLEMYKEYNDLMLERLDQAKKEINKRETDLIRSEMTFKIHAINMDDNYKKKIEALRKSEEKFEKLIADQKTAIANVEKDRKVVQEDVKREQNKNKKQLKAKDKKIADLEGKLALRGSTSEIPRLHGSSFSSLNPKQEIQLREMRRSSWFPVNEIKLKGKVERFSTIVVERGRPAKPGINTRHTWRSMPVRRSPNERYIHIPDDFEFLEDLKDTHKENIEFSEFALSQAGLAW